MTIVLVHQEPYVPIELPSVIFTCLSVPVRQLWEHYLSSAKTVADAVITQLAERLELPPPAVTAATAQSVFNDSFQVGGAAARLVST